MSCIPWQISSAEILKAVGVLRNEKLSSFEQWQEATKLTEFASTAKLFERSCMGLYRTFSKRIRSRKKKFFLIRESNKESTANSASGFFLLG